MKNPAFQFYVQDFIHGTLSFTAEETGAYILLLCRQWDKGFVEENDVEVIAKLSKEKLEKVFKKFSNKNGRLTNKRMAEIRKERDEFSKKQASKGKAGAAKRWQRPSSGHPPAMVPVLPGDSSSSPSSSSNNIYSKGRFVLDTKIQIPVNVLEAAEMNQFTMTKKKNTNFIKSQWLVFIYERLNENPPKYYSKLSDLTQHFLNWIRNKHPKNDQENIERNGNELSAREKRDQEILNS